MEDPLAADAVVDGKAHPDERHVKLPGQGIPLAVADDQVRGQSLGRLVDLEKSVPFADYRRLAEQVVGDLRIASSDWPLLPPEAQSTGFTPISARKAVKPTTRSSSP